MLVADTLLIEENRRIISVALVKLLSPNRPHHSLGVDVKLVLKEFMHETTSVFVTLLQQAFVVQDVKAQ